MSMTVGYDRDLHALRVASGGGVTHHQLPREAYRGKLWYGVRAGVAALAEKRPTDAAGAAYGEEGVDVDWNGKDEVKVAGVTVYKAKPWDQAAARPPSFDTVRIGHDVSTAGAAKAIGIVGPKLTDVAPDGSHIARTGADVPPPAGDDPLPASADDKGKATQRSPRAEEGK